MSFEGRVVIVTGGTHGLGLAFGKCFARAGAKVIAVGRTEARGKDAEKIIGECGEGKFFQCDVADAEAVNALVDSVVKEYGRIDAVVNAAQGNMNNLHPIAEETVEDMRASWETGLLGAFNFTKACLPIMIEQHYGRFVNIASNAGVAGLPGMVAYGTNKEAIRGLTRVTANENGAFGITANSVTPFGATKTTMDLPQEMRDAIIAGIPVGRIGDPEKDVAPLVLFLASEEAGYVTAQTIGLDGGMTRW